VKLLVLYNSRNGHTRDAAEGIAQVIRDLNHEAVVKSVIEVQKKDIEKAEALFVGTWVHGLILFGVKPAGAEMWVPALPSLEGKPVAVFCTYAFNPRRSLQMLSELLAGRGATIIGQRAFHRSRLRDGAVPFVQDALQATSLSDGVA
jgi:flavodoxin